MKNKNFIISCGILSVIFFIGMILFGIIGMFWTMLGCLFISFILGLFGIQESNSVKKTRIYEKLYS